MKVRLLGKRYICYTGMTQVASLVSSSLSPYLNPQVELSSQKGRMEF